MSPCVACGGKRVPLDVYCPTCGAELGDFCQGPSGRQVYPHRARLHSGRLCSVCQCIGVVPLELPL